MPDQPLSGFAHQAAVGPIGEENPLAEIGARQKARHLMSLECGHALDHDVDDAVLHHNDLFGRLALERLLHGL